MPDFTSKSINQSAASHKNDITGVDLETFVKTHEQMVGASTDAYDNKYDNIFSKYTLLTKDYSPEELTSIINHGSLEQQQKVSEQYYYNNGYYQQFINYYATLLKYAGVLIPNANGKSLSAPHIVKKYNNAIDYLEKMNLSVWLPHCARRALIYGVYYGLKVKIDKNTFTVIDLPVKYCKTQFKDINGNDVIQFNTAYFSTILSDQARQELLKLFPEEVRSAVKPKDGKKKTASTWVILPSDVGVCFSLFEGRPLLLKSLPAILDYAYSVDLEHQKDQTSIDKIIVQHVPHLNDGRLVFETDEALEMHRGSVGMLKAAKGVKVLTSYADVTAIASNSNSTDVDEKLNRLEQNIYAEAGVSGQLFAPTGSASLGVSLNNDLAIMMQLANKFSVFITSLLNSLFSNSNVSFKYKILPISYYNAHEFIEDSFKLVTSGYSVLAPALAQGFTQKEISDLKDLENDLLKLNEKLIPLSTAYTQSEGTGKTGNESITKEQEKQNKIEQTLEQNGRPKKPIEQKSEN